MPIHDWTAVRAGTFHNFHVLWTSTLTNRLNAGLLPPGFFAMAEQVIGGPEPDVVSLHTRPRPQPEDGGVAVAPPRPRATFVMPVPEDKERYARKANRIVVHHELGNVVAVIEIVSPGNKESKHAVRAFVEKAGELIRRGVNLLVVDLFPPGARDPQGVHQLIWDEITDQPFELPPGKPLTLAAYQTAPTITAYVEPVAVGDRLPDMPLFLHEDHYVNVPLEETYQTTWDVLPVEIRRLLPPSAPA
ncbi:MAG TPA: DUF4058 family protein [Gemmataceae bacterium]|nr:DUF4058 family protein [Gemmataceae bacterium]